MILNNSDNICQKEQIAIDLRSKRIVRLVQKHEKVQVEGSAVCLNLYQPHIL